MEDIAPGQDGGPSDPSSSAHLSSVINISTGGEVILNVKFESSPETIRSARTRYQAALRKPGGNKPPEPTLHTSFWVAYRVQLDVLRKNSGYFDNLFGNTKFAEAKTVKDAHDALKARGIAKLEEANPDALPWIDITDDDEATGSAGREMVFEDMLRILHGKPISTGASQLTMMYLTSLAVLADRFDCRAVVGKYVSGSMKFKWPLTSNRPIRADESNGVSEKTALATEQLLRQKILVAWLLEQPLRLQQATREIIMRGSHRWSTLEVVDETPRKEAWWDLPDDLERELAYRRDAILNTIASIQRYFLDLYISPEQQCTLGYDSSIACDSFQLGQMLKFLQSKFLVTIADFGPSSFEQLPDAATLDIDNLLNTLRQCPAYQIDRFHTNCGLRTRLEPIIEYVKAMLSSNVIAISHREWTRNRPAVSWFEACQRQNTLRPTSIQDLMDDDTKERQDEDGGGVFEFTRALASDQRLKYEGTIYADKMARKMFLAHEWYWTEEL